MSEVLVTMRDVALTYGRGTGQVHAVRNVSGSISRGERIALTGPSGSGKSSLLHLVAGLERPTAGSVDWPAWSGVPRPSPARVGVMFQTPNLVPTLDVVENVALPLLLAGVAEARAEAVAEAALERLHLARLRRALPETLSGGQAQRVNLARVLAADPALLVADEPTGQLDRRTGDEVIDVMLDVVRRGGMALVVSTHDPAVADRLDSRWAMRDGTVVAVEVPVRS